MQSRQELSERLSSALEQSRGIIPQPAGSIVAEAYRQCRLDNLTDCLHVIAVLLSNLGGHANDRKD